jgi:EmrB/QacA subfamily drug resistance transporter
MVYTNVNAESSVGPRSWAVLALLALAEFMVVLDVTVVNVALPSIGASLRFDRADLSWVITAYVLFTGGLMLLGGRAADLLGRRRVFLAGLLVFTAASLVSGLAWSPSSLIVSRAVQGVGAALLLPSALSIVTTTYVGEQRAKALAVWAALGSAGAAAGVLLGGVLTTLLSWEWIFFINVPLGAAVALGALRVVSADRPSPSARARLDVAGAVAVMGGLFVLVYAIEGTATHGWGSARTFVLLAVATALLAAFAAIERAARAPLVPPVTWRARSLVSGAGMMLGATGLLVGAFFLNTVYLQDVLGWTALQTGLAFLPLTLVILIGAHLASHLIAQVGTRGVTVGGLLLLAVGALVLAVAPDDASFATDLLPGFVVIGLGAGLTFPAVSVTAMASVHDEGSGLASGLMTTGHELGAALGVAVLSAVATSAPDLATGYGDGFTVAAIVAGALALVSLLALPAVRPAPGVRVAMH